jgi:signal transduction histidine kinase
MNDDSLFETVLASTVHDMKNSLSLLLARLEDISLQLEQEHALNRPVSALRYEAGRINGLLMQLLAMYKLDRKQLEITNVEVDVIAFVEDCIAAHSPEAEQSGISLGYDCDEELLGFFDQDLIGIAINNILGNSIRYSSSRVLLSVQPVDSGLQFTIADDGEGYPQEMIDSQGQYARRIDSSSGSTGLGLFFSDTIARLHRRGDNSGHIELANGPPLGGGCFRLILP